MYGVAPYSTTVYGTTGVFNAVHTRTFVEEVVLVDSFTRQITSYRVFGEVATLVDTVSLNIIYTKILTDVVALADNVSRLTTKVVSEVVTIIENVGRGLVRAFVEIIIIVEGFSISRFFARSFSEIVSLVEATSVKITGCIFTEAVALNDIVLRGNFKVFSDVIALVENIMRQPTKLLIESTTLADTMARVKSFARAFVETLIVNERIYGLLNGVNMLYTDIYSNVLGDYTDQYFDI